MHHVYTMTLFQAVQQFGAPNFDVSDSDPDMRYKRDFCLH